MPLVEDHFLRQSRSTCMKDTGTGIMDKNVEDDNVTSCQMLCTKRNQSVIDVVMLCHKILRKLMPSTRG